MPKFGQRVSVAVEALSSNPAKDVDENDFIDASRLVYDGVREIRRAVLMNRVSIVCVFKTVIMQWMYGSHRGEVIYRNYNLLLIKRYKWRIHSKNLIF